MCKDCKWWSGITAGTEEIQVITNLHQINFISWDPTMKTQQFLPRHQNFLGETNNEFFLTC